MKGKTQRAIKPGGGNVAALGKFDVVPAILGFLVLAGAYQLMFLPEALALLVLAVSVLTVVGRAWHARRGGLEYGLLRHPFRRELRPYLLQCLNRWLFWTLFGATILVGTFTTVPGLVALVFALPVPDRMPYPPLVTALWAGVLVLALLALVPRRRVHIATNVLVAIGTVFLATQLVRIHTPPTDPVALHSPLVGEWAMLAGGRSTLISHHFGTAIVRDAVDFVRLDAVGRGRDGDPRREDSWYGFGEPVLAPADGTVVSVSDVHPDEPVGDTGRKPSYGNHVLLDIGSGHYVVLGHLQQGSARVGVGERVQLGQQVGSVGDSGDSLVPHLHLQVQDSADFGDHVRTFPIVFRDILLIRGGHESMPDEADLRRGDHIRSNRN